MLSDVYTAKRQGHVFSKSVLTHKPVCPSPRAWAKRNIPRKNVATNALPPSAETSQKHLFGWPVYTGLHFWGRFFWTVRTRKAQERKQEEAGCYRTAFREYCAFLVSELFLQCVAWGKLLTKRKSLSR